MKVNVEVECTPEEARAFLGLPDVAPLNDHLVAEMKRRMDENMSAMQPDELMKTWTSFGMQAQDQFRKLMEAGAEFDAIVYGTEALGVMRIEKGHVAGGELNGQSTALNMGLGKMVSKKKDSIGMVLSQREGMNQPEGYRLVGVKPVDPKGSISAGSHFMEIGAPVELASDGGWLTSKVYSPHLGCDIALGYLKAGDQKIGRKMRAVNFLTKTDTEVEIVSPHFFDPEGERLRG
jgi:sarcosine oxidase subunit alpha